LTQLEESIKPLKEEIKEDPPKKNRAQMAANSREQSANQKAL